jgi:hypothetical protein
MFSPVLLFFLFLALKLAHVTDWNWWVVFIPLIVSAFVALGALIFTGAFLLSLKKWMS